MKNAILIHGSCDEEEYFSDKYPSLSNSHWFPWLQKQLLINRIFTQTPEFPNPPYPKYEEWKKVFERFNINENTILVGHSCGGGFIVRWLSENKVKVEQVVLVAPWLDPDRKRTTDFFEFNIDPFLTERIKVVMFASSNDDIDIQVSMDRLKKKLPNIQVINFQNYGHFCYEDMKTNKFPELLDVILRK